MQFDPLPPSQTPNEVELAILEGSHRTTNELVISASLALAEAQAPVEAFEQAVRRLRAKRSAALQSKRITENAARACGLANSLSTRSSVSRQIATAEGATAEIREIVSTARSACTALDDAHDSLRSARAKQLEAMHALSCALEQVQLASHHASQRRGKLIREIEEVDVAQRNEEAQRRSQAKWIDEGPFDPHYDAREIALRRARPWV